MRINNIPVAGLNPSSNFIPFNNGSGFVDSGFEIGPAPPGMSGNAGFQTRIGITPVPISNSGQSTFGLKFIGNLFFGTFSYIGDFDNSYNSTAFSIIQYPNSNLNQARLTDYFSGQTYFNIQPNNDIYGIGDDVTDATTFNYGMIVDSSNNRVIMRNTSYAGFIIVPSKDDFRFGMLESDYYIGLRNNSFLVSSPLVESGGGYAPTNNWLRLEWQGQLWYVQLHQ